MATNSFMAKITFTARVNIETRTAEEALCIAQELSESHFDFELCDEAGTNYEASFTSSPDRVEVQK